MRRVYRNEIGRVGVDVSDRQPRLIAEAGTEAQKEPGIGKVRDHSFGPAG